MNDFENKSIVVGNDVIYSDPKKPKLYRGTVIGLTPTGVSIDSYGTKTFRAGSNVCRVPAKCSR